MRGRRGGGEGGEGRRGRDEEVRRRGGGRVRGR